MSDFTRWWLILAAQIEAAAAWRRVRHYCWRYQSVAPLYYLRNPRNQFGWLPLSWLFLWPSKHSLLDRIKNELAIELPYPRHYTVKTTPRFSELKAVVTEDIRAESLKTAQMEH